MPTTALIECANHAAVAVTAARRPLATMYSAAAAADMCCIPGILLECCLQHACGSAAHHSNDPGKARNIELLTPASVCDAVFTTDRALAACGP